jgi:mRNA interferase RelE/StbE
VDRILGLADDPRPPGSEKLAGGEDRYRVRQGFYRIVYEIDDATRLVRVVKVGHRRDVYRH